MGKGHAITKLFKALILILKDSESKYFRTNDLNNVLNKQVFKKKKGFRLTKLATQGPVGRRRPDCIKMGGAHLDASSQKAFLWPRNF